MKLTICTFAAMLTLGLIGLQSPAYAGCGGCAKGAKEKPHVHKKASKCGDSACKKGSASACKKGKKSCADGCTKPCCEKKDEGAA